MTARSQPIWIFTLTATRVSQQPIRVLLERYKRKTAHTDPSLTTIPRGALERRGLAHNDCLESAYTDLHPDCHPSESIAYTGPTLTAIREKQPI